MTTENSTVRPTEVLVVAVRPAAVPVATGPFESPSTELTLPEPVPSASVRTDVPAGADQVVSVEDFSVHTDTNQEAGALTATDGVVWLLAAVFTTVLAEAETWEVAPPDPR